MTAEALAVLVRASLAALDHHDPEAAADARSRPPLGLALALVVAAGLVRRVAPTGRELLAATYAGLSALLERRPR